MARPSPGVGVTVFEKWQCTGYQKCITHGGTVVNSDLLPLCPVSLMHKKCQRHKIIHGKHPMGRKGQCNDAKVYVEYPVHMISVVVLVAVV